MTKQEALKMKRALEPFAEIWKGISKGSKNGELGEVKQTDEMFRFSDGTEEYSAMVYEFRNAWRALNGKDLIDPFETKRKGEMNPDLAKRVKRRRKKGLAKTRQAPVQHGMSERDKLALEALGGSM